MTYNVSCAVAVILTGKIDGAVLDAFNILFSKFPTFCTTLNPFSSDCYVSTTVHISCTNYAHDACLPLSHHLFLTNPPHPPGAMPYPPTDPESQRIKEEDAGTISQREQRADTLYRQHIKEELQTYFDNRQQLIEAFKDWRDGVQSSRLPRHVKSVSLVPELYRIAIMS